MLMKTGELSVISHDVDEKKGVILEFEAGKQVSTILKTKVVKVAWPYWPRNYMRRMLVLRLPGNLFQNLPQAGEGDGGSPEAQRAMRVAPAWLRAISEFRLPIYDARSRTQERGCHRKSKTVRCFVDAVLIRR
jgi:hypothetical protein